MLKQDTGLFLLRVITGAMMLIAHGWPKLMNYSQLVEKFPDPIGIGSQFALILAIFTEFFCAILLILGLWTRIASGFLLVTMLVAAFIFHINDPWSKQELATLYGVIFMVIIFAGPGSFAVDKK